MSDYTPTTEEVRQDFAYPWEGFKQDKQGRLEAFDRWIVKHDREVKAKALRDAARDARFGISRGAAISLHHECHKHQCKCGNPGSTELVRQCFLAARDELLDRAQQLTEES